MRDIRMLNRAYISSNTYLFLTYVSIKYPEVFVIILSSWVCLSKLTSLFQIWD